VQKPAERYLLLGTTAAIIRWPDKVKSSTTSYAMFSIMDFLPTFAQIVGGKVPTDRAVDGVDRTSAGTRLSASRWRNACQKTVMRSERQAIGALI
jgi:arylsulfatase A-like enzyme